MKGVTFIKDKNNRKKALVIELKSIKKNEEEIHELIDVLVFLILVLLQLWTILLQQQKKVDLLDQR